MPDEELMNRLCAAVLLFAVLFCLPRSAGAGEPLAAVSESELARIVHEGDGRPLVLVYWAWCVPCRHFREKLEKIRAGYPESELRMLAVSLDRDPGPAMAYLARSPLPYPARIGDAELIKARSGMPVPTTILYRRDGRATFRKSGWGITWGGSCAAECREAPRSRAGRRVLRRRKERVPGGMGRSVFPRVPGSLLSGQPSGKIDSRWRNAL